jgi:hypothetical protein
MKKALRAPCSELVMQANFLLNGRHMFLRSATRASQARHLWFHPVALSDMLHWYYVFDRHLCDLLARRSGASQY